MIRGEGLMRRDFLTVDDPVHAEPRFSRDSGNMIARAMIQVDQRLRIAGRRCVAVRDVAAWEPNSTPAPPLAALTPMLALGWLASHAESPGECLVSVVCCSCAFVQVLVCLYAERAPLKMRPPIQPQVPILQNFPLELVTVPIWAPHPLKKVRLTPDRVPHPTGFAGPPKRVPHPVPTS